MKSIVRTMRVISTLAGCMAIHFSFAATTLSAQQPITPAIDPEPMLFDEAALDRFLESPSRSRSMVPDRPQQSPSDSVLPPPTSPSPPPYLNEPHDPSEVLGAGVERRVLGEPEHPSQQAQSVLGPPSAFGQPFPDGQPAYQESESWLASSEPLIAPPSRFENLSLFAGLDGSKQPQDFGVNANFGAQTNFNWGFPLVTDWGLGMQVGSGIVATGNAVNVYDQLGEATDRFQSFTTIGLFQRMDNLWSWAIAHDFLFQDSYGSYFLSQWRLRLAHDFGPHDQWGITLNLPQTDDRGWFTNIVSAELEPIRQGHLYWRHAWPTAVQTTAWIGLADLNTGRSGLPALPSVPDTSFLFGADFLAPVTAQLALYGETNLIMPADKGAVDAFLGLVYFPRSSAISHRRSAYSPMLSVAAPTNFTVDVRP